MTEKFRFAFDITPVPMLLVAEDGTIVMANEQVHDLFEYEDGALVGKLVDCLVPKDQRSSHPQLRDAYHRYPVKRNMGAGRDLCGVTKSGAIIPLELGLEPVTDGDQRWSLVVAIDISQRKKEQDRMLLALDASASAMIMVDDASKIVFANTAANELTGYARDDLLGQAIDLLIPKDTKVPHSVFINGYMNQPRRRTMGNGMPLFMRHKSGKDVPVEVALTPVNTAEARFVMSTIVDLSERLSAAQAMEKKNAELEALNTELSQFAYSASHDLKAPLTSITGLLSLCLEDLDDSNPEELRETLSKVIDICRRSAVKVESLLSIAYAGRSGVEREWINLEDAFHTIWIDLTGNLSNAELKLDFAGGKDVLAEAVTLTCILENLLSNALRYCDSDKAAHVITVTTKENVNSFVIRVSDNGVGIAPENQSKVFDMFQRLDQLSGDGLGLSLARKQVLRMGGEITLESALGEGTTFVISLPRELRAA